MLGDLKPQPSDAILALMQMYREDTRKNKIDLGVGVYKNAAGVTPVMRAVKAAEKQLWEDEQTKSYVGLVGDPAYGDALSKLILGDSVASERIAKAATPGGTGAIRQALELIRLASPTAKIWIPTPTWPNHPSIISYLGMEAQPYRYFDAATGEVDFDGMIEDIATAAADDVILLHGCCHNPTGANLTAEQWRGVVDVLEKTDATPLIDIAYQGFGDGLEQDAVGTRLVASQRPEVLIAASCSKNFGIYRERAGLLIAIGDNHKATQGTLAFLNRQNFSFPPDHGARLVTMVLNDDALRMDWMMELEDMRSGMLALREQLAAELRQRTNSDRFDFVARHRGMFSLLGLSPDVVLKLREEHGVYMVGDSRVNIAGLNAESVPVLARAVVEAGNF